MYLTKKVGYDIMITLTRNDLEMMLDEMYKNDADNIELDVHIQGYEWELDYIDFDMCNGTEYIKTVLTL